MLRNAEEFYINNVRIESLTITGQQYRYGNVVADIEASVTLSPAELRYIQQDVESCKNLLRLKLGVDEPSWAKQPEIKNVKFSGPCTIVFWTDNTKTVVRAGEGDEFDPEKGLAMAIAKKVLGTNDSKGNYYDVFKEWLPKETKKPAQKSLADMLRSGELQKKISEGLSFGFDKINDAVASAAQKQALNALYGRQVIEANPELKVDNIAVDETGMTIDISLADEGKDEPETV